MNGAKEDVEFPSVEFFSSDYIDRSIEGVNSRLQKVAEGPIADAVRLMIKTNTSLQSHSNIDWFDKIKSMSSSSQLSGKRYRARLAVAVSNILGVDIETSIHLGTFVELIQAASLVHDDVVDEANSRRGKQTVNVLYGNRFAVLTGDYIISQALIELGIFKSQELVSVFANVISQMTLGEAMEIDTTYDKDRTLSHYLGTISLKTGSLMSFCSLAPCIIANCDLEVRKAMTDYGLNLGMAFQMADDLMDMIGPEGKKMGKDFEEGILTYPMILLEPKDGFWDRDFDSVKKEAVEKQTLAKSLEITRGYCSKAKKDLEAVSFFVKKEALDLLCSIADSIVEKIPKGF